MQTNNQINWEDFPTDIQHTIIYILYSDIERDKVYDKRCVNKQFKNILKNVHVPRILDEKGINNVLSNIQNESALLDTLQWYGYEYKKHNLIHITKKTVNNIAKKGFLNALEWLKNENVEFEGPIMEYAARRGDLNTLQWLDKNMPDQWNIGVLESVLTSKNETAMFWVLEQKLNEYDENDLNDIFIPHLSIYVSVDVIRFVLDLRPDLSTPILTRIALEDGPLHKLQCVYDHVSSSRLPVFDDETMISLGELNCSKEIIEFVYINQFRGRIKEAHDGFIRGMGSAVLELEPDREQTLNWLRQTLKCECECKRL